MHHRTIASISLTFAILTGCGEHTKTTDTTTHGDTHAGATSMSSSSSDAPTTDTGASSSASADSTGATTAAVEPPAAPTDLTANILEGGVHVTWKDVADNEDNYILENKADGEADFSLVLEMPFDSVTYHDIDVMAGTAYTYRVKAVNVGGESVSAEVMVQVP